MNDFLRGADHALSGFRLVTRPGLRRFVVLPLLVNALLFIAGGMLLFQVVYDWVQAVQNWLPEWLAWLSLLLWPIVVVLFLGMVLFGFTALANLVGAPFNGILSERCARLLRPDEPAPIMRPMLTEALLALRGELKKIGYYLIRALPLLALTLVPGIGFFASIALLALTVWMLGVEYMDYPMGNAGLTFVEQRRMLPRRRLLILGFGATVFALTLVPVLNLVVMPAAVAGATKLWVAEGPKLREPGR